MKIAFFKISNTPLNFDIKNEAIEFSGNIVKKDLKNVKLQARIFGEIPHFCNHCGADITLKIDENLDLIISDGISDMSSLDVVECLNGDIDLDEILLSEIEAYKSDYFYCENCKNL